MGKLDDVARARIKAWAKGAGMTQRAVAEQIGKNDPWLSRFLDGTNDTDLDTLQQLAAVFGRTLWELLDVPTGDPQETELIERFRSTRDESRPALLVVVRQMTAGHIPRRGAGKPRGSQEAGTGTATRRGNRRETT
jgi:transcriptional regulator with XRE-family HTH domain